MGSNKFIYSAYSTVHTSSQTNLAPHKHFLKVDVRIPVLAHKPIQFSEPLIIRIPKSQALCSTQSKRNPKKEKEENNKNPPPPTET